MTRVFLTGATGNAGRPVLAELLRRGHDVTALVRRNVPLDGCRTVVGDLADIGPLADEVAAAEAVIHLASPRGDDRDSVVRHDILGTGALLDAWQRGNFVYTSSQTVYGIPRQLLSEDAPLDALCWYDLGKVCNEFQLRLAEPDGRRGAAVSLRMALLFANGPRRDDRQFLSLIVRECRQGGTFVFDSLEGLETYGSSFLGAEDFGRAVADALEIEAAGSYNIASGFCTWRELIETIDRHAGTRSRFVVRAGGVPAEGEFRLPQSRSELTTGAFAGQTGFVARQSLDEVVGRYIAQE